MESLLYMIVILWQEVHTTNRESTRYFRSSDKLEVGFTDATPRIGRR